MVAATGGAYAQGTCLDEPAVAIESVISTTLNLCCVNVRFSR